MSVFARTLAASLVASALLASCLADRAPEPNATPVVCKTDSVTYTNTIAALITTNCNSAGCHNEADFDASSGIPLYDYQTTRDQTEGGNVFCAIRHEDGCKAMPQDKPQLSACQIAQIQAWADQGYQE